MMPSGPKRSFRHYVWTNDTALKLTNVLHSKLVAGEVVLSQFAGTTQRIIEAIIRAPGSEPDHVTIRGSTYVFDEGGALDLSEVPDAVQAVLGHSTSGNVVNLENAFGYRRWANRHQWSPPPEATEQVLSDIIRSRRPKTYIPLPLLKAKT